MWQFTRMRNRAHDNSYRAMARCNMDPHSPWAEKGPRVQELRKNLFPTFKRIPGRKMKFFYLFSLFLTANGWLKVSEIRDYYG